MPRGNRSHFSSNVQGDVASVEAQHDQCHVDPIKQDLHTDQHSRISATVLDGSTRRHHRSAVTWISGSTHRHQVAPELTGAYGMELRSLGLRVRALRDERAWTQETAAERMGLDVTHLAKIERGTVNLTFGTIVRIAEGLEEPVATLFVRRRRER